MSIDTAFYDNVFLLTKAIPPSKYFERVFKKGMFNRPNTAAFIHVSHYLLNIYNATRFNELITWPLMCNEDVLKYRVAVKNYLTIVSVENPDLNFPSILMSHLIKANGTKFLHIMWKMSQIALRAYLERDCQVTLCRAPRLGQSNDLTKKYFTNLNQHNQTCLSDFCNKRKQALQNYDVKFKNEIFRAKSVKSEIFAINRKIEELVPLIPLGPDLIKRLKDVDDTEIIHILKIWIRNRYKYLAEKNKELRKLNNQSSALYDLIRNLIGKSNIYNAPQHPITCNKSISLIYAKHTKRDLKSQLYQDGHLVFKTFFLLFAKLLEEILISLQKADVFKLCRFEPNVKECCEIMKIAQKIFKELHQQILTQILNQQHTLMEAQSNSMVAVDLSNLEILLTSPKLSLSISENVEDKLLSRLWSPPQKDQYKQLFKRHYKNVIKTPENFTSKFCLSTMSEWECHGLKATVKTKSGNPMTNTLKYSRLFQNRYSKAPYLTDYKATSTPYGTIIQSPSNRSDTNQLIGTPKRHMHMSAKNLFDLTYEITNPAVSSLCCHSPTRRKSFC